MDKEKEILIDSIVVEQKSNFVLVSCMIDDQFVGKKYIDYSIEEAKKMFINEFIL